MWRHRCADGKRGRCGGETRPPPSLPGRPGRAEQPNANFKPGPQRTISHKTEATFDAFQPCPAFPLHAGSQFSDQSETSLENSYSFQDTINEHVACTQPQPVSGGTKHERGRRRRRRAGVGAAAFHNHRTAAAAAPPPAKQRTQSRTAAWRAFTHAAWFVKVSLRVTQEFINASSERNICDASFKWPNRTPTGPLKIVTTIT